MKVKLSEMKSTIKKMIGEEQFRQLNPSIAEQFKILQERGIEVILDVYERSYPGDTPFARDHKPIFTSSSDFILVHKTHFIPHNGAIKTSNDVGKKIEFYFNIKRRSYELNYEVQRKTVHTCVNGEVSSHSMGNWDDCEYIVLIPFDEIPRENIAAANTVDTYTKGEIILTPNSWIICPENEVESIKANNPGINVIGYTGDKSLGAGDVLVQLLGYTLERGGAREWNDANADYDFYSIMKKEGIETGLHDGSKEHVQENNDMMAMRAVEVCKFLKKENFTEDDILHCFFPSKDDFENGNLIDGPLYNAKLFLEKMKEEGFDIPEEFITIFETLPSTSIINCKLETLLLLPENISEEKKKMLEPIIEKINEANEKERFDERDKSLEELSSIMLCEVVMSAKGMKIEHPYKKEPNNVEDIHLAIESCAETCKAIASATDDTNELFGYIEQLVNCDGMKDMNYFVQKMKEEGFDIPLEYVDFFNRLKGIYGYKYVKLDTLLKIPENIPEAEKEIFNKICDVINNGEYEKRDELIKDMFSTMVYGSIMRSKEIDLGKTEENQEISQSINKFHKVDSDVQVEKRKEELQELKQEVEMAKQQKIINSQTANGFVEDDSETIGFRR